MADQMNRGIGRTLVEHIERLPPNAQISANDELVLTMKKKLPNVTDKALMNALGHLAKKKIIRRTDVKGVYRKTANGKSSDVEQVVIDNLLTAMAEAEPVLKRCKKLLAALQAV